MQINTSESIAAIEAEACLAVSRLHNIDIRLPIYWKRQIVAGEIDDTGVFPTRNGAVIFYLGNNSSKVLEVSIKVERLLVIGYDETWVGKFVGMRVPGNNWTYAYVLDWKTGNGDMQNKIELGKYPHRDLDFVFQSLRSS